MDLFILIVTCAINVLLGLFVFVRDPSKSYTKLFAGVCLSICLWIVANYITNHYTQDLAITNIANNVAYISGFTVLLCALLFTYAFPVKRSVSLIEKLFIACLALIIVGLSATDLVAGTVSLSYEGQLLYSSGPLISVYIAGFILVIAGMVRNLLWLQGTSNQSKQRQAKFILLAFGGTAFLGLFLNVIIPLVRENWHTTRFGPLVTVVMVATIAYTIVRHGLFDIRLAVVRSVAYILSLATLAFLYYIVLYTITATFLAGQFINYDHIMINVALALMLAFLFQPVRRFFDKFTNKIFYREHYSIDEFFARLSKLLSATTDLRTLLQRAVLEIYTTMRPDFSAFFVHYGDKYMTVKEGDYRRISEADIVLLSEYISRSDQKVVVTDALDDEDPLYRLLSKYKVAIVLPLRQASELIGYLFLGGQHSRDYTKRDVRALETISDELVIAIQNALSLQEVKELNATLQQRIAEATKELRQSNRQLQKLDVAKDEFISMASHQLRTPLTSVKGYLSMVLEGDVGAITKAQHQLLAEAFSSSERMVHLIGDFLNVSRLQTGRFMLETRRVDLVKVVSQEVDSLRITAEAHNLKIYFRKPAYFPVLLLDEAKMRQVIMNYIDNAIYYSHEGTTIEVKLYIDAGEAVFEVKDTGIGVPKEEQASLFTKFFRATNARKQRPDGTGVGLFLTKKVIDAHSGRVTLDSSEGKGSTFGFRLPIKKLTANSTKELDQKPNDNSKN